MQFNNRTYNILKYIALVALPATEALWLTLGKIWSFPYTIEIGATIAAVDVFLGALLGVSNANYNKMIDGVEEGEFEFEEIEDEESEVE